MPTATRRLLAVTVAGAAVLIGLTTPALAQPTATGPEGQTLRVSKTTGLAPGGESVSVEGAGYDETKGVYVAFCVDNGAGVAPGPCGGGADTTGSLGASHWISSNPPSYGQGLAQPYGAGGSFSVTLRLTPTIGDIDCTNGGCAVATRADHTRSHDRSQDILIPVRFSGGGGQPGGGQSGSGQSGSGNSGGGERGGATGSGGTPATGGDSAPGEAGEPEAAGGPSDAPTAGPTPPPAAPPAPDALAVSRIIDSDSAGQWWWATTGTLLALLVALAITGRIIRRRQAAR